MTYSYKHLPVALGSLLGMLCPVLNVLIGLCWFGEAMTAVNAAGIAHGTRSADSVRNLNPTESYSSFARRAK